MSDETTAKAVKPKYPAKPRLTAVPAADGTLCRKSVHKLTNLAKQIKTTLDTMEKQLVCAVRSVYIAPQLITKLTADKEELETELQLINAYKEDNHEGETTKICTTAKKKLDTTLHQFKLLKKMLRYEDATTEANALTHLIQVCLQWFQMPRPFEGASHHQWRYNPALVDCNGR